MTIEIRTIHDSEIHAFRRCMLETFGHDVDEDPAGADRQRALVEPDRQWAAFDGGDVVATAGAFSLDIATPGGSIEVAGLTMVTVRPSHRRRGILRGLMELYLADARTRAVAVDALWASEATIYGRFGFGAASIAQGLTIDARDFGFLADPRPIEHDRMQFVDEAVARVRFPPIYRRALADRPGSIRRTETWWRERRFLEGAMFSGGASKRRYVIVRRDGADVGYICFRQRESAVVIVELIAVDAIAETALWRFVTALDLFPKVTWDEAPVDSMIADLAVDPRRVVRKPVDALWLRIEDPIVALAKRRYATDDSIAIRCDEVTLHLAVAHGEATVTATDRAPDLVVDRATLGSLFLGGGSARALERAGRITGDAARADRLFAWPIAPWCPEVF